MLSRMGYAIEGPGIESWTFDEGGPWVSAGHRLDSWSSGVSRARLETEVIVKEKCKDLIQCQKI
jgi:hypothetical protein